MAANNLSEDEVIAALAKMRRSVKRHVLLLLFAIVFCCVAFLLWNVAEVVAVAASIGFALFLFAAVLYAIGTSRTAECPLCRHPFFVRRLKGGFRYYNDFTRCCLNCGLKLDGSNARALLDARATEEIPR